MESSSLFTFKFNQRFPRGEEQGGGGGGGGPGKYFYPYVLSHIYIYTVTFFMVPQGEDTTILCLYPCEPFGQYNT